jgi:hypothetical protein
MADLFVLVTCGTEPFVAFVLLMSDHSAERTATLTKLTRALTLTSRFLFMIIETCVTPKVSVA